MKIKDGVENWQILQALVNGTKLLALATPLKSSKEIKL